MGFPANWKELARVERSSDLEWEKSKIL
jgi:hypothetical protein